MANEEAIARIQIKNQLVSTEQALRTNQLARETFEKFNYSQHKEYGEWIIASRSEQNR